MKKARNVQKLVFEQLHMPEMHLEYSVQVKDQFESLNDEGEETTWEAMRDILIETAENILPKEKKRKEKKETKMDDRGDFFNDGRQAEVK